MNHYKWMALGAAIAALAVALGAFGAHLVPSWLEGRWDDVPRRIELWRTASAYQMYSALGLLMSAAALRPSNRWMPIIGGLFLAGIVFFSGSLYLLALTPWNWLGMLAPLGGLAMIAAWMAAALALALIPPRAMGESAAP